MSSEWATVSAKNRRRRSQGTSHTGNGSRQPQGPGPWPSDQPPTAAQVSRWCSLVAGAQAEVAASAFYRNLGSVLSSTSLHLTSGAAPVLGGCISRMVMWGLGSLDCGLVHIRYQLALAQLLRGLLGREGLDEGGVDAFDPVFSALDRAVLGECGIQVTPHDPKGRHVATHPTFFFLPHCDLELTQLLLASNVAAGTLCNAVVLGNSFELYCERWEMAHPRRKGTMQQQGHSQAPNQDSKAGTAAGDGLEQAAHQEQRQRQQGSIAGATQAEEAEAGPHEAGADGKEMDVATQGLLYDLYRCGAVEERAVGERGFPVASAFNDMALHVFAADWRERLARQRGGT